MTIMGDVRKNLLDILERLRQWAGAPDADEDAKQAQEDVKLLCGSEDVEHGRPHAGAVMSLIEIIRDYEALTLWTGEIFERLSPEDRAKFGDLRLGPFDPGGVALLHTVFNTAIDLGRRTAKNPTLRAEATRQLQKLHKAQTGPATRGKQKKEAEAADLARQLRDEGLQPKLIPGEMAKRDMERSAASIYAYLKR